MTKKIEQLRLRVFAGPNGSGKSTVIQFVRNYKVNDQPIDFGYYINADDIAGELRTGQFRFKMFGISTTNKEFFSSTVATGLINEKFTEEAFKSSYQLKASTIKLLKPGANERLAQIIADFLRKKLLEKKERFSFETVFSHPSKLEIMKEAKEKGYKVYLYFVSTESPEINKLRVRSRKDQGGHDVPTDLIESRYYRSLDLLYEACQVAYQVYFFDNSIEGEESDMFAHFKMEKGKKHWDEINLENVPAWFRKYYSDKIKRTKINGS
ncbi:MAG: zeta toxin family protein [Bacteroidota bacterium]|nr:zeta toxin family protein [Bacteroidota bacterium]